MRNVVHTTRSVIVRERGPTRKATIEGFPGEIYYGVHGGIKDFYKAFHFLRHFSHMPRINSPAIVPVFGRAFHLDRMSPE